jgi:TPR repeat protein
MHATTATIRSLRRLPTTTATPPTTTTIASSWRPLTSNTRAASSSFMMNTTRWMKVAAIAVAGTVMATAQIVKAEKKETKKKGAEAAAAAVLPAPPVLADKDPHHGNGGHDDDEEEEAVVLTPEELAAQAALKVSLTKAEAKAKTSGSVADQWAVVQILVQLDDYEKMAEWLAKIVVPDRKLSSDPAVAKVERATISKAAENLAQLAMTGLGVDEDGQSAQRLLERAIAVDNTNNSARTALAFMVLHDDFDRAASLLRQASDQDYPVAQFALAMLLGKGKKDGTKRDPAAAVKLLEKASHHGHTQAMVAYARCLLNGTGGIPIDVPKAVTLVRQAAAQQEPESLIVFSELLMSGQADLPSLPDGIRVEKNEAEAMTLKQQLSGHGIRRRANWP